MTNLTLVLPAHNEELSIRQTIREIADKVPTEVNLTIFVSEDGSSDSTREIVKEESIRTSKCRIKLSETAGRLGYSKAVVRGISSCETEIIAFMDSDGQVDPENFFKLLKYLEAEKFVTGYRAPRNDPVIRIIYSALFGFAYTLLGGPNRKDPSSPFVICYLKDVKFLTRVDLKLEFGFWWEFQWRLHSRGLKTTEVPINHRIRTAGTTKVYSIKRIPKIALTHVVGLLKLRHEINTYLSSEK
jgi:glycosyltransferase involved in cell wall biosynthesis